MQQQAHIKWIATTTQTPRLLRSNLNHVRLLVAEDFFDGVGDNHALVHCGHPFTYGFGHRSRHRSRIVLMSLFKNCQAIIQAA